MTYPRCGGHCWKPGASSCRRRSLFPPEGVRLATIVWTIGHSTHPIDAFIDLLRTHAIEAVTDVRRFPGSRRHPHFAGAELERSLDRAGIAYLWLPSLGGRRRPEPDSPNTGWRHAAFQGYADHIMSEEFAEGIFELLMAANGARTAVMCAELLWWRCHRRLIADTLLSLHHDVRHIVGTEPAKPHRLLPPAHVENGRLSYAPVELELPLSSEST